MSESVKFVLRPKVRFSQFSDNEENNEECYKNTNRQANCPKIRNIITLKKPVRIVDSRKSTGVHEKNVSLRNCEINKTSDCTDDITSRTTQNTIVFNDNVPPTEVSTILHDIDNNENKKKKEKILQVDKNMCMQNNVSKYCRNVLPDKENKNIVLNKSISNKNIIKIRTGSCQLTQPVVREKLKLSSSSNDIYKIEALTSNGAEMTKSRSTSSITKNIGKQTKMKSTTSNVIPCYKYIKPGITRNKISPIKKTVLHNITGPKVKTFVGPGVSHERCNNIKANNESKKCYITSDVEKWMQPKHNSIMCTLNKLDEIKQQKIFRNGNNFLHTQKNFLSGKISTALDFPLDEVIFKNLVDLSINDEQVLTIMRSKDPEPRQKDVTPKLSDFFTPQYTKDICTFAHVKFRALKLNEEWDTFRIGNKILDWRHSLDDM